ncbi:MAG: ABC transporter permease [Lachnospiraceae bacterium]|jgi:peptide/nickel transport system permease protein|nr:ABC transporter permease [uncultured Acetatifactor sp.]MCI9570795.1 ABC transporter permease [Lachnospiraceae bacterium]NBJ81683.1 ABC transporter permease [bacterium 1XD42-76]NBK05127.1 ABC transporter permease [bacterium 1XD42-94]
MLKYVFKRLLYAVPVFLGITFAVYVLINLAPGGPLSILASSGEMSLSDLEALKISLGLDKPIIVRYFMWLGELFRGDMGISYRTSQEVSLMVAQRIKPSLMLTGVGILGAILIGVPLGIISAYKPNSIWDHISTFVAFIGASVPNFFLSLLLIYVLAVKLKLFPTSGMYSAGSGNDIGDLLKHLALPAFVCGIQPIGNYIKQTKSSVLEVLNEEYIKTARSKGLTNVVIVLKHAFRNALIPIVTTISLSIPFLIGGAVVTEQIFAWPGIGSLMITAITSRDYPVIMGVAVLICIVVLVANLILDLIYAALDPRIKFK